MKQLLLDEPYRSRVRRVRHRLEGLQRGRPWLTKTWIGHEIGRNRSYVTQVLHEQAYGPPTLELIERLLDEVEAEGLPDHPSGEGGEQRDGR